MARETKPWLYVCTPGSEVRNVIGVVSLLGVREALDGVTLFPVCWEQGDVQSDIGYTRQLYSFTEPYREAMF